MHPRFPNKKGPPLKNGNNASSITDVVRLVNYIVVFSLTSSSLSTLLPLSLFVLRVITVAVRNSLVPFKYFCVLGGKKMQEKVVSESFTPEEMNFTIFGLKKSDVGFVDNG